MVPVQDLELISPLVAEDEEAIAKQIQVEGIFNECGKAIYVLAHIRGATGEVDGKTVGWD